MHMVLVGEVSLAVTLFVVGVLLKYAGTADKLGKNFDYIMAGALAYLLGGVLTLTVRVLPSIHFVTSWVTLILSVIGFVAVAVGTILGAIDLITK